jgi:hypothetical protein
VVDCLVAPVNQPPPKYNFTDRFEILTKETWSLKFSGLPFANFIKQAYRDLWGEVVK